MCRPILYPHRKIEQCWLIMTFVLRKRLQSGIVALFTLISNNWHWFIMVWCCVPRPTQSVRAISLYMSLSLYIMSHRIVLHWTDDVADGVESRLFLSSPTTLPSLPLWSTLKSTDTFRGQAKWGLNIIIILFKPLVPIMPSDKMLC